MQFLENKAVRYGTILILVCLIFVLQGCATYGKTRLQDPLWDCKGTDLSEYERKTADEYIQVKCKE